MVYQRTRCRAEWERRFRPRRRLAIAGSAPNCEHPVTSMEVLWRWLVRRVLPVRPIGVHASTKSCQPRKINCQFTVLPTVKLDAPPAVLEIAVVGATSRCRSARERGSVLRAVATRRVDQFRSLRAPRPFVFLHYGLSRRNRGAMLFDNSRGNGSCLADRRLTERRLNRLPGALHCPFRRTNPKRDPMRKAAIRSLGGTSWARLAR